MFYLLKRGAINLSLRGILIAKHGGGMGTTWQYVRALEGLHVPPRSPLLLLIGAGKGHAFGGSGELDAGNADVTTKTVLLAFLQGTARDNAKQKAQQNAVSAWNHWQMQAAIKPEYVDFMKHFATEVIANAAS